MTDDWRRALDDSIDARFEELVAVRRRMHAHPEPSGEEQATTLFLYQLLSDKGFDPRMGPDGVGVIAALGDNGPPLAIRADIDALRIQDEKQVEYRSQCNGVMHACGHDAHTAVVLGALWAIDDVNKAGGLPWSTPLRTIFQPAEETCEGAKAMVESGAIDGVSAILATHMDPSRKVGRVGLRAGVLTANCDEMRIAIHGQGGHAARPHEASDPIAAAVQLINSLYLFIPRVTDSQDAVVITIGSIRGGDHANVIPERVELQGTVRTLDASIRGETMDHIRRLAEGVGETSKTRITVEFGTGSGSVRNDPELIALLRRCSNEILGESGVEEIPRPSMGSEDFAYYLEKTAGAMIRVGCASHDVDAAPPLHSPMFDIDEDAIRIGAKVLARAAVYWSKP